MPQIEVAFDIDANGIINVSAKDLGTGNEQQIKIEGGSGLKPEEVEQMIKNAEAHADEAHKLRELADAKNNAEALAYADREERSRSTATARRGRRLDDRGPDHGAAARRSTATTLGEIRAKTDALQEASHKLAEAASTAQATAPVGGAASGNGEAAAPTTR